MTDTDKMHFFKDPQAEFDNEVWAAVGTTPADALQLIMRGGKDVEDGFWAHKCPDDLYALAEYIGHEREIIDEGNYSEAMLFQQALEYWCSASVPKGFVPTDEVYFYLGDHDSEPLDPLFWMLGFLEPNTQQEGQSDD